MGVVFGRLRHPRRSRCDLYIARHYRLAFSALMGDLVQRLCRTCARRQTLGRLQHARLEKNGAHLTRFRTVSAGLSESMGCNYCVSCVRGDPDDREGLQRAAIRTRPTCLRLSAASPAFSASRYSRIRPCLYPRFSVSRPTRTLHSQCSASGLVVLLLVV
jgi:hypothetical protein